MTEEPGPKSRRKTTFGQSQPNFVFEDPTRATVQAHREARLLKMAPAGPYLGPCGEVTAHLTPKDSMDWIHQFTCPYGREAILTAVRPMVNLVLKHPDSYDGNAHFMAAAVVKHFGYWFSHRRDHHIELGIMYDRPLGLTWIESLDKAIRGTINQAEMNQRIAEELELTARVLRKLPHLIQWALVKNHKLLLPYIDEEYNQPLVLSCPPSPGLISMCRQYKEKFRLMMKYAFIDMTVLRHEAFEGQAEQWIRVSDRQALWIDEIEGATDRRVEEILEVEARVLDDRSGRNERLADGRTVGYGGRENDENRLF